MCRGQITPLRGGLATGLPGPAWCRCRVAGEHCRAAKGPLGSGHIFREEMP